MSARTSTDFVVITRIAITLYYWQKLGNSVVTAIGLAKMLDSSKSYSGVIIVISLDHQCCLLSRPGYSEAWLEVGRPALSSYSASNSVGSKWLRPLAERLLLIPAEKLAPASGLVDRQRLTTVEAT